MVKEKKDNPVGIELNNPLKRFTWWIMFPWRVKLERDMARADSEILQLRNNNQAQVIFNQSQIIQLQDAQIVTLRRFHLLVTTYLAIVAIFFIIYSIKSRSNNN